MAGTANFGVAAAGPSAVEDPLAALPSVVAALGCVFVGSALLAYRLTPQLAAEEPRPSFLSFCSAAWVRPKIRRPGQSPTTLADLPDSVGTGTFNPEAFVERLKGVWDPPLSPEPGRGEGWWRPPLDRAVLRLMAPAYAAVHLVRGPGVLCTLLDAYIISCIVAFVQADAQGMAVACQIAALVMLKELGTDLLYCMSWFVLNNTGVNRVIIPLQVLVLRKFRALRPEGLARTSSSDLQQIMQDIRRLDDLLWQSPIGTLGVDLARGAIALWQLRRLYGAAPVTTSIATGLLLLHLQTRCGERAREVKEREREASMSRLANLKELTDALETVKLYGWTGRYRGPLREAAAAIARTTRSMGRWLALSELLGAAIGDAFCVIAFFVSTFATGERIKFKDFVLAEVYVQVLRDSLRCIYESYSKTQDASKATEKIQAFLLLPERENSSAELDSIELSNACFAWPAPPFPRGGGDRDSKQDVLAGISLRVRERELVVVSGPVGSGKSSLLLSLLGETKRTEGAVRLPGCAVAFQPQVPFLLNGSIRQNILFGVKEADADEMDVQTALAASQLAVDMDDASSTLHGLRERTRVGHRGSEISGGQRARTALARVVYAALRGVKVVLLDDPLAAVDNEIVVAAWEAAVLGALSSTTRVVVVNSQLLQRLGPSADRVVLLEGGRVVYDGPPGEVAADACLLARLGTGYEVRQLAPLGPRVRRKFHLRSVVQALLMTSWLRRLLPALPRGAHEATATYVAFGRAGELAARAAAAERHTSAGTCAGHTLASEEAGEEQEGEPRQDGPENAHDIDEPASVWLAASSRAVPGESSGRDSLQEGVADTNDNEDRPQMWAPSTTLRRICASCSTSLGFSSRGWHTGTDLAQFLGHSAGMRRFLSRGRGSLTLPASEWAKFRRLLLDFETQHHRGTKTSERKMSFTGNLRDSRGSGLAVYLTFFKRMLAWTCLSMLVAFLAESTTPFALTFLSTWARGGHGLTDQSCFLIFAALILGKSVLSSAGVLFKHLGLAHASLVLRGSIDKTLVSLSMPYFWRGGRAADVRAVVMTDLNDFEPLSSMPIGVAQNLFGLLAVLYAVPMALPLVLVAGVAWRRVSFPKTWVFTQIIPMFTKQVYQNPLTIASEEHDSHVSIRAMRVQGHFDEAAQRATMHLVNGRFYLWGGLLLKDVLSLPIKAIFVACALGCVLRVKATGGDTAHALVLYNICWGLVRKLNDLNWKLDKALERLVQYRSIEAFIRTEHVEDARAGLEPPAGWPSMGAVAFEAVTFRYLPHGPPALQGLSVAIAPGEKVGVVGPTGSGKSTFLKLLFRLSPLCEGGGGVVRIDGVDVASLRLDALRRAVGVVPQEPTVFRGSLLLNLGGGGGEEAPGGGPDDTRALAALAACGLECLTAPVSAEVSTKASAKASAEASAEASTSARVGALRRDVSLDLSVGQRQLLAAARILLRRPRVLVLDEAAASLSQTSADLLMDVVARHCAGATVVSIAHRLWYMLRCDRILVLGQGGAVEAFDAPSALRLRGEGYFARQLRVEATAG